MLRGHGESASRVSKPIHYSNLQLYLGVYELPDKTGEVKDTEYDSPFPSTPFQKLKVTLGSMQHASPPPSRYTSLQPDAGSGDVTLQAQARKFRLLRVLLQERTVQRLGGLNPRKGLCQPLVRSPIK
jgi:hypothetical protein